MRVTTISSPARSVRPMLRESANVSVVIDCAIAISRSLDAPRKRAIAR